MSKNTPICSLCGAENSWKPLGLDFFYAAVIVVLSILLLAFGLVLLERNYTFIAYLVIGITPISAILLGMCLIFRHGCCICGTQEHPITEDWQARENAKRAKDEAQWAKETAKFDEEVSQRARENALEQGNSRESKLLKVKCPSCGISHMATRKQYETPKRCAQCGQVGMLERA